MLTLPDSRTLGYDDVGDPAGWPMVYLHGTPDSRQARHPDDSLATAAGVRLLAVDRPGYGDSTPVASDTPVAEVLERFASDLGSLLDHLSIDRVTLLTWSGGTLAGLAAAASRALAGRVVKLVVVAGVVPREAYDSSAVREADPARTDLLGLADEMPPAELAEMVAPMLAPYPCDHALAAEHQREQRSPGAQAALEKVPGAIDQMASALTEAVRNGLAGVATDVIAQNYRSTTPALDQVKAPVRLWYGSADQVTPPAFGTWYADHLPHAELDVIEGPGHDLFITRWPEIARHLVP